MSTRILAAAALLVLPVAALAEAHAPTDEDLTNAALDAFAMLGCALDVSDPQAGEMQIGLTMAEVLGVDAARIQTPEGDLYDAVDDAFEGLLSSGALVVDRATGVATLTDCVPAGD